MPTVGSRARPFTPAPEAMSIQERLSKIQADIGDRPVTLVAVTKYATLEQMVEAYEAGVRHFGENKVRDALEKMEQLPPEVVQGVSWHMIGHLQSNKVRKTVGRFALVHSVDSVSLAHEISSRNQAANLVQPILLQVNVSGEASKQGFDPRDVPKALEEILSMHGVNVKGLMTIAPLSPEIETAQSAFIGLARLRDALREAYSIELPELSMGMTSDYIHAINCDATIIRVGSYLFRKH